MSNTPTINIKEYIQDLVDSGMERDEAVAIAKEELERRKVIGLESGRKFAKKQEDKTFVPGYPNPPIPVHVHRQKKR